MSTVILSDGGGRGRYRECVRADYETKEVKQRQRVITGTH